jgi:hypothetical protein
MRLVLIFIIKSSTQQMSLTEYESDNINCICLELRFEDTRGSIRSHKSKKNRQYNGQMKKDIHLQNTTQKTKHETH